MYRSVTSVAVVVDLSVRSTVRYSLSYYGPKSGPYSLTKPQSDKESINQTN